ncbi:PadR family transcriptional regulator [Kibdelosporangium phytohabitans]|uniref:PadR family transcriptional regulator n=1 Tax=Kibdelosporangium phytohabitans TaxID=860235 RepID=A0A0N9HWG8_9PSEU|nr:PadR family transcriptional regulator [Kibdelosporangium phytohabitans]ALG09658.1 PadR family transcriptional regulator [Kibdelosporangium phytohabitans]MBE1468996.1 DNA-binding PadR family transcriptional regulator [Kibdelosporangium phytohabitans]
MALEHAILVSLEERSGSGYELARRFDKSIGFFWAASHQQIYRTLKRMVDLGWVTCTEVAQDGKPDKKVYEVGDTGRAELRRWLAEPGDPAVLRNDLAVKIRGASYGDIPALLAEVARHRDAHAERLDVYRVIEKRDFPDPAALTGRHLHQYLVLRAGVRAERGLVDWFGEVLEAMRRDGGEDR